MKHLILLMLPLLGASAPALLAAPFVLRPVPAGFSGSTITDIGFEPWADPVMLADFTGAGRCQLYAGGTNITKYPGTGTITLPALSLPQWSAATVLPIGSAVLDADGDGDLDIYRINAWSGYSGAYTMQVFLNNGSGGFTAGWREDWEYTPDFPAGKRFYRVCAADYDGDGDVDIALAGLWQKTDYTESPPIERGGVAIRWNDGTGRFSAATGLINSGLWALTNLAAGDVDRDGDVDLVVDWTQVHDADGIQHSDMKILYNGGTGAFTTVSVPSYHPGSLADVDGDDWQDLFENGRFEPNVHNAGGRFGANAIVLSGPGCVLDANEDGLPDIVAYNAGKELVEMSVRESSGGWHTPESLTAVPGEIISMTPGDADADGDTDIILSAGDGKFYMLENIRHHFVPAAEVPAQGGTVVVLGVTQIECADFNRDGYEDVLAFSPSQGRLQLLAGASGGMPVSASSLALTGGAPGGFATGDFDGDGRVDAAYTLPQSGEVRMVRNTGGPLSAWPISTAATGIQGVTHISAGEAGSANGQADLLVSSSTTGQVRWLYRDSAGAWTGQNVRSTLSPAPNGVLAANAGARPGDEPFCLTAGGGSLSVRRYELNPGWTEAAAFTQTITAQSYSPVMAWGDMNGDRDGELIFVNGSGTLSYWSAQPGGATLYAGSAPGPIRGITATDWDRDGRSDVLCATDAGISLFRGGDGWKRVDLHSGGTGYQAVRSVDLNKDGFPDAAAVRSNAVEFFLQTPRVLRVGTTTSAPLSLAAGSSDIACQTPVFHPGRAAGPGGAWSNDEPLKVTGARVSFVRVGTGTPLTMAELTQLVHSVSLTIGAVTVGSTGPAAIGADGSLRITYNSLLGNLVPLSAGASQTPAIRLNLKSTAYSAQVNVFDLRVHHLEADTLTDSAPDRIVPLNAAGTPVSTRITITQAYTPIQVWRNMHFGTPDGTGVYANGADFDGDGVPNLVEYALGTRPAVAEPALNEASALTLLPIASAQSSVRCRLGLSTAAMSDAHLRVTIQSNGALNAWNTLTTRTGGGAWTGLQPQFAIPSGEITTHTFTTGFTPQGTPHLFLRLKVEELP